MTRKNDDDDDDDEKIMMIIMTAVLMMMMMMITMINMAMKSRMTMLMTMMINIMTGLTSCGQCLPQGQPIHKCAKNSFATLPMPFCN